MQGYFKGHGSQRMLKWHDGMTLKEAIDSAGGIDEEKAYAIVVDGRKKGIRYAFLLEEYIRHPEWGSILIERTWQVLALSKHCYQVLPNKPAEPSVPPNTHSPSAQGVGGR
jgi:hypothetical protein